MRRHSPLSVSDPLIASVHNRSTVFARWRHTVDANRVLLNDKDEQVLDVGCACAGDGRDLLCTIALRVIT